MHGQDYDIGIRAGLNYSKFNGPSEAGVVEEYNIASGFHFGINFQWNFNTFFGVRSEVIYQQTGTKYRFDGDGYYIFRLRTFPRYIERDKSVIELDVSNAYITFPITAHLTIGQKLEVFGGGYFGLLVSPVGSGTWSFALRGDESPEYAFEQGLDFDYRSDRAGEFNVFADPIGIIVNDQNVDLAGFAGAYYLYDEAVEVKKFKSVDYGLVGGLAYYLNRGLYISGRLEYGLQDITNTLADISYREVNSDGTFIFNDDNDRNLNIGVSLGFRF